MIKYCPIKYLTLLKIQFMMGKKRVMLHSFISFLIKKPSATHVNIFSGGVVTNQNITTQELAAELPRNQLLENKKN